MSKVLQTITTHKGERRTSFLVLGSDGKLPAYDYKVIHFSQYPQRILSVFINHNGNQSPLATLTQDDLLWPEANPITGTPPLTINIIFQGRDEKTTTLKFFPISTSFKVLHY